MLQLFFLPLGLTFLVLLVILANEGALLSAFEFESQTLSLEWLINLKVDRTLDHVAWLVERQLGLQLYFAF